MTLNRDAAREVLETIEDPLNHLDPNDRITYGEDIAEVLAEDKAPELVGYLASGELEVPADMKEKAAAATFQFRLDRQ